MVGASFFIPPAVPEAKLSHTRAKLGEEGGNDREMERRMEVEGRTKQIWS